ncbi:MAG: membrane dipeptidase [Proteobacteria bacterium]|nr:membrane dipeptidase [Pseudomonadota bacterium]
MPEPRCFDMHGHAGALFLKSYRDDALLGRMAEGRLYGIVLSALSDRVVVDFEGKPRPGGQGGTFERRREPEPGECRRDVHAQLDLFDACMAKLGVRRILGPEDVGDEPGAILAIEGGCQLEGRAERLREFYDRGVRLMQPVHYRINELGDVQTAPPRHGGLSEAGREVVREMNRLGMVVDGTHATFDMMKGIVATSSVPVVLSHDCLQEDKPHPRFLSPEHARLVAESGGVVGVQAAAYADRGPVRGLEGHVEKIKRMVDAIGIDHVGVGTDMGTAAWPPSAHLVYPDFKPFAELPSELRKAGFTGEEVAKIASGNFLRLFRQVTAARRA